MAASKSSMDKFANVATISCTESAANTLTYKKLETGIATFDKLAWIINQIEYFPSEMNSSQFNSSNDGLNIAFTVSNGITDLSGGRMQTDPQVIHGINITRQDIGAAASGSFLVKPFQFSFASLPGGGLIIPPTAIYLGVQGSGLAAVTNVYARIYYTVMQLAVDDYWELIEARRVISA